MTNFDSILKSRDITLPTKVCLIKAMFFPVVMYWFESWTIKKSEYQRIDAFELWCWRRLLRVPWTCKEIKPVNPKGNQSWIFTGRDWCWSWSSNNLATWWEELTHWKRPWCWKTLKAKGEEGGRGWDGWMASVTQWAWVWANSGRRWRTRKPGVLQSMDSWRVGHNWVTEQLNNKISSIRA